MDITEVIPSIESDYISADNQDLNSKISTKPHNRFEEAVRDYVDGFLNWELWSYLAYADIRRRYRRTLIGPFWTTLSLALYILSLGVLFSTLWKTDLKTFLPYFSSGMICWTFISTIIADSCCTYTSAEGLLKQIAVPYAAFSWLVVARNFLVFLHQIVIYICIALVFHIPITKYTLLAIPGFLLLFITTSWLAILLGFICARFRDIQQVISSLLQILVFITPIFWTETQVGGGVKFHLLINSNPLYHYLTVIRQPLLGMAPSLINWCVVCFITILGWLCTMTLMSQKQRSLIYWL